MSLSPSHFSIYEKHRWRYVTMALVLVAVQLLSQLHSLKHLDDFDGDSHLELSCSLCLLMANLDHSPPLANLSLGADRPSGIESVPTPEIPHFSSLSNSFYARAPPVVQLFS